MKIIKMQHSLLFLFINPNTDLTRSLFVFYIGGIIFKTSRINFDLNTMPLVSIIKFYENINYDWTRKYRV